MGKVLVVILAVIGLAIAYKPPGTFFDIVSQAFTGLALLFPTVLAALYWKRATAESCMTSIIVGELLLIGLYYEVIPAGWTFGFLPVVPLVLIASVIIIVGSLGQKVLSK